MSLRMGVTRATCAAALLAAAVAAPAHADTVTVTEGTNIAVTVAPDHRAIVFDLQGNLYKVPATGGTATPVTEPPMGQFGARPDWSPDGDIVVFQAYVDSHFHIVAMRPDGSRLRQLTTGTADHREPSVSPDGSKIAFSSDRAGSYDIWVLDRASGELTQWTDGPEEEYQPTWAPDGNRIAYVAGTDAHVVRATDAAGRTTEVANERSGVISSPSYSPTGDTLAYTLWVGGRTSPMLTFPLTANGHSHLVVAGQQVSGYMEDVFPASVEWLSPTEIVYAADGKIKRRNLVSGDSEAIPFEAQLSVARPEYTRKRHRLGRQRVKAIAFPVVSPDGSHVAFKALNDLWVMEIGGKPRRITNDHDAELHPTWSPEGRYLAYSSDREGRLRIYIRNMRTGRERRLELDGPVREEPQIRATWCPHGDKLAFQAGTSLTAPTYVADIASGGVRQVLPPMNDPGRPTWGPGCDHLALVALRPFSARFQPGTNEVRVRALDGGDAYWADPARSASIGGRVGGLGPVWSPNGESMAFVRDAVLWIMPVAPDGRPTGAPRQVTSEVADYVSWTGDSQRLMYLSKGRLRLVSVHGGRPRTIPVKLSWDTHVPRRLTVIRAGALWDGTSPTVRRNVDILVRGDRIVAVLPARRFRIRARYVDASHLTVMPGLFEAHAHLEYNPYLGSRQGRQLLAYGITSAMSMGDAAYTSRESREAVLAGAETGPRVFTSAELLDGTRVPWADNRPIATEEVLERQLDRVRALDVDILKSYERLPARLQEIAIRAAHDMGIPAFSHYFHPALAFGQDGVSHVTSDPQSASQGGHIYDDVVKLATASDMSMTYTPLSSTTLASHPEDLGDPRVQRLFTDWQREDLQRAYERVTTTDQTPERDRLRRVGNALARIQRAGGVILAGSDMPHFTIGLGLHETLRAMVELGGFTPYEALRTATRAPAERMGVADELGTIERGKLADLAFVEGNPLDDIAAAAKVRMVMRGGRLHTLEELVDP